MYRVPVYRAKWHIYSPFPQVYEPAGHYTTDEVTRMIDMIDEICNGNFDGECPRVTVSKPDGQTVYWYDPGAEYLVCKLEVTYIGDEVA
jgi:hypothetical protein